MAWIETIQLPPHNIDAEKGVLGGALMDQNLLFSYEWLLLSRADFYKRDHQVIYDAISVVHGENKPVDMVTVSEQLTKMWEIENVWQDYLFDLQTHLLTTSSCGEYAQIVKECSIYRQTLNNLRKLSCYCMEQRPLEEIQSFMEKSYTDIIWSNNELDFCDELPIFQAELYAEKRSSLSSGFSLIDTCLTGGGFKRGQLVCIAGRPWTGKSSIMTCLAMEQIEKYKVAMFSLEMGKMEIAYRLVSYKSQISYHVIDTGVATWSDYEKETIPLAFDHIKDTWLRIYDKKFTMQDIKWTIRKLKVTKGLDIVYIDYLQLIKQVDSREMRSAFIGSVTRELKRLAKEMDIVVVIGSQLNREVEKRVENTPKLSDLRESWDIEQDCDIVIFLSNEEECNDPIQQKNVIVAKQRNGPKGSIPMSFVCNTMTLQNKKFAYRPPVSAVVSWRSQSIDNSWRWK